MSIIQTMWSCSAAGLQQQIKLFTSATPDAEGEEQLSCNSHSLIFVVFSENVMAEGFHLFQNQHEELKKQYYELQEQHQIQGEDHGRLLDEHRDRYEKLQQAKESEVNQLKGAESASSVYFPQIPSGCERSCQGFISYSASKCM